MKWPVPENLPVLRQIRIENTNACGYKCTFCPREKMDRPVGIQSVEDFVFVMDRVEEYLGKKYSGGVHLHGYGEPLLDKKLPEKIKLCHARWPKIKTTIITTLGYNLSREYIQELVDSGLCKLVVSFYGSDPETYKAHTTVDRFDIAFNNLKLLLELAALRDKPMEIKVQAHIFGLKSTADQKNKENFLKQIKELKVPISYIRLHNYGDGRNYLKSKKLLCERAIGRRFLQVTWDLNVKPCGLDYNAQEKFGNLRTMTLKEIFMSEKAKQFLSDHCNENADVYSICKNCTMRCLSKIG